MRFERYDCEASAARLVAFSSDPSWRVRTYVFAALARRGVVVEDGLLAGERDLRVIRAILRGGYRPPREALVARIAAAERSNDLSEATCALECLAALGEGEGDSAGPAGGAPEARDRLGRERKERMDALLSRIVLRMSRTEAGFLSPRLAAITGAPDWGRDYRWREWFRKNKSAVRFLPAALAPSTPAGARRTPRNRIAELDPARFVAFERYLASVAERPMDLAILIDCTASMSRELSEAQGGVDELFEFLGSVTKGVRVGIVGYRDRTDKWETRAWDFTGSLDEARKRLWSLSADGGGDEPESVYAAMRLALSKFTWLPGTGGGASDGAPIRACVLVGDAPPHVGEGNLCIELARRGHAQGVRFYGIVARESERNLKPEEAELEVDPDIGPDAATPDTGDTGGDQGDELPSRGTKRRGGSGDAEPPRAPPPVRQTERSHTWFPEIAEAGGGRAEILGARDSLVAEIAELTIADRYREEFAEFFAAFRVLCR